MKITNPTKDKITVQIFGDTYSVDGESTVSVPEDVARYWVTMLHEFLVVSKEEEKKEEKVEKTEKKSTKKTTKK